MVKSAWSLIFTLSLFHFEARALLGRTQQDLRALQDRLQFEFGRTADRRHDRDPNIVITPILVASPRPFWEESKLDFAPSVLETLSRVFSNAGDLIACSACLENRVYVASDHRTVMQNGELSLADLARLRQNIAYAAAKSVLTISETPRGLALRVVAIDDGRILYAGIVDSTQTLNEAEPPLRLARELDRRQRGEALTYVNVDIGFYPNALVQLKFLEQWGSRNQNLSGFVLSAYNPSAALGVNYTYMLPLLGRRLTAGATGFYKLDSLFKDKAKDSSDTVAASVVGQVMINYAVSGSYGFFVSASSEGVISAGVSLMNPVLFPFLL